MRTLFTRRYLERILLLICKTLFIFWLLEKYCNGFAAVRFSCTVSGNFVSSSCYAICWVCSTMFLLNSLRGGKYWMWTRGPTRALGSQMSSWIGVTFFLSWNLWSLPSVSRKGLWSWLVPFPKQYLYIIKYVRSPPGPLGHEHQWSVHFLSCSKSRPVNEHILKFYMSFLSWLFMTCWVFCAGLGGFSLFWEIQKSAGRLLNCPISTT